MPFPVIPFLLGLGAALIHSGFKRTEEPNPNPRPKPKPKQDPEPVAPTPATAPEPVQVVEAPSVAVEDPKSEEGHSPSAETEKALDSEPTRSDNE